MPGPPLVSPRSQEPWEEREAGTKPGARRPLSGPPPPGARPWSSPALIFLGLSHSQQPRGLFLWSRLGGSGIPEPRALGPTAPARTLRGGGPLASWPQAAQAPSTAALGARRRGPDGPAAETHPWPRKRPAGRFPLTLQAQPDSLGLVFTPLRPRWTELWPVEDGSAPAGVTHGPRPVSLGDRYLQEPNVISRSRGQGLNVPLRPVRGSGMSNVGARLCPSALGLLEPWLAERTRHAFKGQGTRGDR